jgi:hypothetical protein
MAIGFGKLKVALGDLIDLLTADLEQCQGLVCGTRGPNGFGGRLDVRDAETGRRDAAGFSPSTVPAVPPTVSVTPTTKPPALATTPTDEEQGRSSPGRGVGCVAIGPPASYALVGRTN